MPLYKYKASALDGKIISGEANAADEIQLNEFLRRSKSYYLISCKEHSRKVHARKLKAMEISDFCRQIGAMLGAGITLVRAMSILLERELSPNMEKVVNELYRVIKQGTSLSEAMENIDGAFPPLLINMIKAGEESGSLDKTCVKMASHFENEHKTNSNIKSALAYPILLVVLMICAIIGIFTFILPKFLTLFDDMDTKLPVLTQIVIGISNVFTQKWYILLIVTGAVIFGFKILLSIPKVKLFVSGAMLKMGKIGKLLKIIYTARFCRTFSSLYAGGISILNAFKISKDTIGCPYIAEQFDSLIQDIRQGVSISESIKKIDGFDSKLKSTVLIGEESGRLQEMLESTADTYDYESEVSIKKLTMMIEPIMICVIGGMVAVVFLSVMMPIYSLYSSF